MENLLYIDLFCGAGGTSTGVERARYDHCGRNNYQAVADCKGCFAVLSVRSGRTRSGLLRVRANNPACIQYERKTN